MRFRFLILQSRGRFTPQKFPSKNTSRRGEKMEKGKKKKKKSKEPKHRLPRGK